MTSAEKDFLKTVAEGFKTLTTQLVAYQEAVEIIRETHPDEAQRVDTARIDVLNSPVLRDAVHQKFDVALAKCFEQAPESLSDSKVSALFQAWIQKQKPSIH